MYFFIYLFIYLLYKNNIIYTTHITILNLQYIIKHYLQYIIKILGMLTLFLFTYLSTYYVFMHNKQRDKKKKHRTNTKINMYH